MGVMTDQLLYNIEVGDEIFSTYAKSAEEAAELAESYMETLEQERQALAEERNASAEVDEEGKGEKFKYVVYSNTGAIDNFESEEEYTIEKYLEECHLNGCFYENEDELYLLGVNEVQKDRKEGAEMSMQDVPLKDVVDAELKKISELRMAKVLEEEFNQDVAGMQDKPEYKEVAIKFSEKLVSQPFSAKDGKEYVEIKIPNQDNADKSPWATFVLPSNHVHKDNYSDKMWAKLPEKGSVTLHKAKVVGKTEDGKKLYDTEKISIANKDLRNLFHYKTRSADKKPSLLNNLSSKQETAKKTVEKSIEKPQKKAEEVSL